MASVHQCDICGKIMKNHVDGLCSLYKYDSCNASLRSDKRLDVCFDCYRALIGFLKVRKRLFDYDRVESENTDTE